MTEGELIIKQQLKIEEYKQIIANTKQVSKNIHGLLYGIGQPLNDNMLGMNNDQLKWAYEIAKEAYRL